MRTILSNYLKLYNHIAINYSFSKNWVLNKLHFYAVMISCPNILGSDSRLNEEQLYRFFFFKEFKMTVGGGKCVREGK